MREDAEPREKPREFRNMQAKVGRFLSKSNRGKIRDTGKISDADVSRACDAGATILRSLVAGWAGIVGRFLVEGTGDCCHSLRQLSVAVTSQKVPVEMQCLDEYLRKQKIEKVDFVKLDVEGGELEVLRGATRLLRSAERPIILAEVEDIRTAPWGCRAEMIIRHLEGLGYRWQGLTASGSLVPLDTAESYDGNFVAWPEERLREMRALVDL